MIIKSTDIKKLKISNKYLDVLLKQSFFFDIETTGLSHKHCSIISITALLYEDKTYRIYQLFCEHRHDEKDMLKYFKGLIKGKTHAITYNGNTFDISFIHNKATQHQINLTFDNFIKIDLYNDMRKLKHKIVTKDLKLKTVEEYFNIKRKDLLSGQDVTILYEAYTIEPRKEFSDLILEHNYEDVYNLPYLFDNIINLYDDFITYKDIAFKINYADLSFKKNNLTANFHVLSNCFSDLLYPSLNFDLTLDHKTQILKMAIPTYSFKNDDIKTFYYLKNEDYQIVDYTTIQGIRKNLIPLKYNDTVYYDNINFVVKKILNSVFDKNN